MGVLLCFTSCKSLQLGQRPETPVHPFVRQTQSDTIAYTSVKMFGDSIKADGDVLPLANVQAYADSAGTFAKTTSGRWGKLQYTGKINLYNTDIALANRSLGGNTANQDVNAHLCFLKPGTDSLLPISYARIKPLIPKGDPAYNYLRRYRNAKSSSRELMKDGTIMTALGVGLLTLFHSKDIAPRDVNLMGTVVTTAGVGCLSVGIGKRASMHRKLQKAIGRYNGISFLRSGTWK